MKSSHSDGDLPQRNANLQDPAQRRKMEKRNSSVLSPMAMLAAGKITKEHWKPDADAAECYNLSCRKAFNFFERKHHCRKCGNIFCAACLMFEIRLLPNAEPSPSGVLAKVCSTCFNEFGSLAETKRKSNSLSVESAEHEAVRNLRQESLNRATVSAEDLRLMEDSRRPRESSEETLVSEEMKKKFLEGVDHEEYLTRRRRTREFLEKRLARRPSVDEVSEKLKNWDWSTF